jgi:WD40 repeat protein/energy-coupling factor transporter ATP-binding protein EcfA2
MTDTINIINPFPGLRPFDYEDRHYFFGRDIQSSSVIKKLINQKFTTIIGSSGSGKSSLINAGVIPGILQGTAGAKSTWSVIKFKPGTSPVENLSRSIAEISGGQSEDGIDNLAANMAVILRNSNDGLAEILLEIQKEKKENFLLVIDQFEDLFRFKRSRINRTYVDEHDTFIDLITAAHRQAHLPIYIVLAIRSDFIDECQHFNDLNHLINESSHILPKLTYDDLKEVISKPAEKAGGKIEANLVLEILDELKDRQDPLPLLQHLLNRMWENWLDQSAYDKPVSFKNYEAVGGIDKALVMHAEDAYNELTDSDKKICERLFKVITEKGLGNQEITIPTTISEIAYINRSGVNEIIPVIEKFRQPERPFLVSAHGTGLSGDSVIDLAHESLMRLWPRLKIWIEEEADSIIMYNRIVEASKQYQRGRGDLWTTPHLEQAVLWHEKNEPSFQWSQRYNTAFERAMQFLNKSREEQYLKEADELEIPIKQLRNTRIFAGFMVFLVILSALVVFYLTGVIPEMVTQINIAIEKIPLINNNAHTDEASGQEEDNDDVIQNSQEELSSGQIVAETIEVPVAGTDTPMAEINEDDQLFLFDYPISDDMAELIAEVWDELNEAEMNDDYESTVESLAVTDDVEIPQPSSAEEVVSEEILRERIMEATGSIAESSMEVEDSELKALLALQSHVFNERYNGTDYNAAVYAGLITSIKSLYGNSHNEFKGHAESVNSLVFRPNSSVFYSASSDGRIMQWDVNDENKRSRTLLQRPVVLNQLAISGNAQWLAVATDGQGVLVFNPEMNNPEPHQIPWGNNRIITLEFYPDNEHIVFAGSDNSIIRHNVRTNTHQVIAKTESEVMSLSVSPGGEMVVAGTRAGQVIIIREEGTPAWQILYTDQGNDILTVKFNNNGSRIAAGNIRGQTRILETASGNLLTTLSGHSARVVDIEFCPAGKFIATSSFDGTIHLWDINNLNAQPLVLSDHGSWVRTVAFNSDGTRMITGSRQESRLLAWNINSREMAQMICNRLTRSITYDEWDRFIGQDIPYMEACSLLSHE